MYPDPYDDMPAWVQRINDHIARLSMQHEPEHEHDEPLPNTRDIQRRCVICGCLILEDAPANAETCTAHRKFEHLRLLVLTGIVTDWPATLDFCGRGSLRHLQGINSPCLVHWIASVKATLSMYNSLNRTHFRLY